MQLIANGVQAGGNWTRMPAAGAYRWQTTMESRHIALTFKPQPSDLADNFALEVAIDADEATQ